MMMTTGQLVSVPLSVVSEVLGSQGLALGVGLGVGLGIGLLLRRGGQGRDYGIQNGTPSTDLLQGTPKREGAQATDDGPGGARDSRESGDDWACPSCRKRNQSHYAFCLGCGHERPT